MHTVLFIISLILAGNNTNAAEEFLKKNVKIYHISRTIQETRMLSFKRAMDIGVGRFRILGGQGLEYWGGGGGGKGGQTPSRHVTS